MGQGVAHILVVEWLLLGVEANVADVQTSHFLQNQVAVGTNSGEVLWARVGSNVAFADLDLLQADRCILNGLDDQAVYLGLAAPVLCVGIVADLCIFVIAAHDPGACANRFAVKVCQFSGFLQLLGILQRCHDGCHHTQVGHGGGIRNLEIQSHCVGVDLFNRGKILGPAVIRVVAHPIRLVKGAVGVAVALHREDHVIHVQIARRLEIVGAVKLHAFADGKDVSLSIGTDRPFLCQTGKQLQGAGLEFHQSIVNGQAGSIDGLGRCPSGHVETLRVRRRAIDQCFVLRCAQRGT